MQSHVRWKWDQDYSIEIFSRNVDSSAAMLSSYLRFVNFSWILSSSTEWILCQSYMFWGYSMVTFKETLENENKPIFHNTSNWCDLTIHQEWTVVVHTKSYYRNSTIYSCWDSCELQKLENWLKVIPWACVTIFKTMGWKLLTWKVAKLKFKSIEWCEQ